MPYNHGSCVKHIRLKMFEIEPPLTGFGRRMEYTELDGI